METIKSAVFSPCEKYRYSLTRVWDMSKPRVAFVMLNPSTADASVDDPTIRRCIAFANSWGYGSVSVYNAFAYRATDPKELLTAENPKGPHNNGYLLECVRDHGKVICAWGNEPILKKLKVDPILAIMFQKEKLFYLEMSKSGTPKHPLYLKGDIKPIQYYQKPDYGFPLGGRNT